MRGAGRPSPRILVACVVLGWMAGALTLAHAHTGGSTAYAAILVSRRSVRYSLTLAPSTLPPAVLQDLGTGNPDERLLRVVADTLTVSAQGRRCEVGSAAIAPVASGGENLTLVVDFACAEGVRDLVVRDDVFDVLGRDHHTLARIEMGGVTRQFAFTPDNREVRVVIAGAGEAKGPGIASFVWLGIEHILGGYDHLLFLLGLLLRGGGWLSLLRIVTAFTLAHSVTLALAVFNVVVLPDRLVEAVIALSIAFVAAENLFLTPVVSRRWLVSFCFGLVHGFGFSSALRALDLPVHGVVVSLLGFNVGVEVGQALVVAMVLPALVVLRQTRWEKRMVIGSSVTILAVGIVLFVERILL
jgi:HupE/UreJ protein